MSTQTPVWDWDLRLAGTLERVGVVVCACLGIALLALLGGDDHSTALTVVLVAGATAQFALVALRVVRPGRSTALTMATVDACTFAACVAFGLLRGRPVDVATPSRIAALVVVLSAVGTATALLSVLAERLLRREGIDPPATGLPNGRWGPAIVVAVLTVTVVAMLFPGVVRLGSQASGVEESAAQDLGGAVELDQRSVSPAQPSTVHDHTDPGSSGARPATDPAGAATPGSSDSDDPRAVFGPDAPLTRAQHAALGVELDLARAAALRYPTVRDARAAGMVTPGLEPGFGAHYQFASEAALRSVRSDGSVDPTNPGAWIYAGDGPDDPVVGVVYNSLTETAPEGFTGPNDHWHRDPNACLIISPDSITLPLGDQSDISREECDQVNGNFLERSNWMVHAWVVPGWDNPAGVFAHENSQLLCVVAPGATPPIGCPAG